MPEQLHVLGSFPVVDYCPNCKGKLSGFNVQDELGHILAIVSCASCKYQHEKSLDQILTKEGEKLLQAKTKDTAILEKILKAGRMASLLISAALWFRPKKR